MLLMMLAAIWVAVLLPPYLRKRAEVRPAASITSFRKQLSVLERTTPGRLRTAPVRVETALRPVPGLTMPVLAPTAISPAQARRAEVCRRRQQVLLGLVAADVLAVMLVAVGLGAVAITMLLVTLAATVGYVALLARTQKLAAERRQKVRHLPGPTVLETAVPARRSAAL